MEYLLEKLEDERRCVKLTLASGESMVGYSDHIIWLEDDEGWETIKAIWIRPRESEYFYALREEEILSYEVIE